VGKHHLGEKTQGQSNQDQVFGRVTVSTARKEAQRRKKRGGRRGRKRGSATT